MKFVENTNRRVYAVDLDGLLTNGEAFWDIEPTPRHSAVDGVTKLYEQGNIIIIWTARQWKHAPETVAWLVKYRVPFHGIQMAKGGADFYIDDKFIDLGWLE